MAVDSSIPAKFSRPRLFDVTPRNRLFSRVDASLSHPVIWVDGPAGAGKTSLVAGYVEARGVPASWYQVDGGDSDVATFFHYLAELPTLVGSGDLPTFLPEYLSDVAGFARRFFRAVFARLGGSALLVFDNVQEATGSAEFVAVLREAIGQVPAGVNLLLISRWEPPAAFARFIALKSIARIGWPELQLTADEAGAIAGMDAGADDKVIGQLLEACGGWAAGLTLMLARHVDSRAVELQQSESLEPAFDFLAAELMDVADGETREFLLLTWVLPRLTAAWAGELTGLADADRILATLFRQNYFIERCAAREPSYQYHGLFREFLAGRARRAIPADAIARLRCRAAAQRDVSPWLGYWRGICELGPDPARARRSLTAALRGFTAANDSHGCIKSIASLIDTCYAEWSDFSMLDAWIAQLVGLLDEGPSFPQVEDELQSVSAVLVAILYRQPAHPRLPEFAARAHVLLGANIAVNERVSAGTYLLNCYNWTGDTGAAREVIARVTPLLDATGVTPLRRAWWSVRLAYHDYIAGERQATLGALAVASEIAREHGLAVVENIVLLYETFLHLSEADVDGAAESLAAFEQRLDPGRRLDYAIATYHRAWLALLAGNADAALRSGAKAVELAAQAGVPNVQGYFLLLVAVADAERGDHEEALAAWTRGHACTDPARFPLFEFTARLVRAYLAFRAGNHAACRAALGTALDIGARHDYANNILWWPAMMARLCALALAWDIEPDYVGRLIRQRQLRPPGQDATRWPWPLRVFTLGAFRVERHGEAIQFSGKVQKRPLALLMALVALGGQDINANLLAEKLWPDADGDAARAALGTALYRLRHLLDVDDAIQLSDGKLTFNHERVWVDAWAFGRLVRDIEAGECAGVSDDAGRLLSLYQGHFLDREEEAHWMLGLRDSLKASLLRSLELVGVRLEQAGQWDTAARVYERGIGLDVLAEPLYRRLMACHYRQGRHAQAIETYRRCRQSLSVVLGIDPTPETEALRRSLD